ncbi:amino acid/polyamine transporter I [Cantharellus anzutake]|uniref:amino acid/polyamine transporter I n=1 Tax=Cantharellus anzutake TaxID=1750568 RepID=UPI001904D0F4|nr:amino acid/polyamine transporter I [Cantharellus anzutake]KAF8336463.1 amino acid/polyamine transporter I [Cantharellus anzutake]
MSVEREKTPLEVDFEVTQVLDTDDAALTRLGISRELRRELTSWSTLSIAFSIFGCVATIASTVNTPILLGGPASAIWTWFLGFWGCLAIAVSVAELVSAYPSSSGAYGATGYVFAGHRYGKGITYVNAWITTVGQLAVPASGNFACSQMVWAAVTIAKDGNFTATKGEVLGLYCLLNVLMGAFNALPTRTLNGPTSLWMWVNLATSLTVIIAVPIGAAHRHALASSRFVWTAIVDGSGWGNKPFAFFLGLLCVQWVMTDYDGVAHLSEEIKHAAIAAPVSIIVSLVSTGVIGFGVIVALCYGIRDLKALPGPTSMVFPQILWDTLGKNGALVLWSFVILIQIFTSLAVQLACVRSMYAISRDGAFPDKRILSRVWRVTETPMNALVVTVILQCLFGLLYLASYTAINAVFSITAVALDLSYIIPTAGKLYGYLSGSCEIRFQPGPFYLGRWGYAINAYAILWTIFETGILIMPQVYPVTSSTMNYAGPIMVGVVVFSGVWYNLCGKRTYWPAHYAGNQTENT